MSSTPRLLALALLALSGCERGPAPGHAVVDFRHARESGGTPVASWKDDRVTAEELHRRLEEMSPALRERYQTLEQKREYVEGLARFELLVQEALARGLQNDPEVMASTKRALVSRLMRSQLDEAQPPVTDAEVAAYYKSHEEDYVRPEQVRLSHVFLAAPRADAARVAAARTKAEKVLAEAKALPAKDFAAFGRLARAHSEEPRTQPLDGDLRYRSLEVLAQDFGPEVAEAARSLVTGGPGTLSGVVQTDAGLHVLQLTGHQPALNQGLEDVRQQISGRLSQEKRTKAWAELLSGLEHRAGFTVDAATLARVHVDMSTPMQPPSGPPPGTIPAPFPSAAVEQP
ncbi:peptidyl-prolyl cis-trans isomerase [Vitiosangium sp. GDMCC 1.1324]|uniref:peptidylprolyl isomerase n=1 Tax=Vitiosangium sp. (strain GDMCC 1.1324) TaxID=2138576 RepID=UPI000D3BC057|nr:peptidylprolyl isomerase [Vitiosangium sp. GDMCC 1.1324]PTL84375.1 peptidyl-prolyl cis-trans isomerase [Vitiosangium sp. GDMCC 1.1324]